MITFLEMLLVIFLIFLIFWIERQKLLKVMRPPKILAWMCLVLAAIFVVLSIFTAYLDSSEPGDVFFAVMVAVLAMVFSAFFFVWVLLTANRKPKPQAAKPKTVWFGLDKQS